MGLFDDLLKKPTANPPADTSTGSSGGNPPVSDPLAAITPQPIQIQKSEEVSITTESAAETAPSAPPPVTLMAETDTSSILISSNVSEKSPITTTAAPENLIGNIEITAPVKPTITSTSEVVDLSNLFGEAKLEESSTVGTISMEETPEVVSIESTPIIEKSITVTESTPIGVEEGVDTVVSSPIPIEPEVISEVLETESIITVGESTIEQESPLISESIMDFGSETTEIVAEESEESYEHPAEFISASIDRIDVMIARIDAAHETKLSEALGYKIEKEKYTALEEQAYDDAEKYVIEKEHAFSMRNYFVEQGKTAGIKTEEKISEPVASVETTLTGLAVQNAVTETVSATKKVKANKQEEEVGLLGL